MRFFLINYLILIKDFINKIAIIFKIIFLFIAIYISIYYFPEFSYFINLENITIIKNNSGYIIK